MQTGLSLTLLQAQNTGRILIDQAQFIKIYCLVSIYFQNDFHVPLTEVPQIVTKSKYPARDPNLKDNWRGRARQDLSNIDDQIIQVK